MGTKEILTLQFGHYSNFIGTHWWNIQEAGFNYNHGGQQSDINHDVLFREGQTNRGEVTFTPRALLVDLKGSLNSLPEQGELYEPIPGPSNVQVEWDRNLVEIQKEENKAKNDFQQDLEAETDVLKVLNKTYNLEEKVQVWSDFLYTRFHPRTVNVIKEYQHCNENTPFDAFPLGRNFWKTRDFQDEFNDKIRNYVEECDSFQGFHVLSDSTNAFSGLSSSCIEYLRDDYDRKSVLVFPVIPSYFEDHKYKSDEERHQSIVNDSVRVLNMGLFFNALSEHSSLFVPLCTGSKGWRQPGPKRIFYHTSYNEGIPYHSSAILASALDTITLKHRLKNSNFSLIDLCVDLNSKGRKAAAASLCLPFSFNKDADLIDCLDNWEGPLTKSITPSCVIGTERMMQHITLRGVPEDRLKRPPNVAGKQKDLPAYKCKTVDEMLSFYLACTTYASANNVTTINQGLSVKTPYPKIFDQFIGYNGNVYGELRPPHINVESVPVLAGLHTGGGVGDMLESLHTEMKKIRISKFHQFSSDGIDKDELNECLDSLFELRENYEDNYQI